MSEEVLKLETGHEIVTREVFTLTLTLNINVTLTLNLIVTWKAELAHADQMQRVIHSAEETVRKLEASVEVASGPARGRHVFSKGSPPKSVYVHSSGHSQSSHHGPVPQLADSNGLVEASI